MDLPTSGGQIWTPITPQQGSELHAVSQPATKTEAMAIIRGLVDKIVLTPFDDGMKAELHGDLARILAFSDDAEKDQLPGSGEPGSQLSVVAGACNNQARNMGELRIIA